MEFLGLILAMIVILCGGAFTGYLVSESDSIIAVLATIFATLLLAGFFGGMSAYYYEENRIAAEQTEQAQQVVHTTHTHCPYCNEVIEEE
jgi:hypothetical protein